MDLSRLRKKFLKIRSNDDKRAYNTQKSSCLTLARKAKKDLDHLDHRNVDDNKTFWQSIKGLFSQKRSAHNEL